jgi:hypothetical protein
MGVAVVESSNHDDVFRYGDDGHVGGQLLVVDAHLARLEQIEYLLFLAYEICLFLNNLENIILMLPDHNERLLIDKLNAQNSIFTFKN